MPITKEDINLIPAIKLLFESKNFKLRLDYFLELVNMGSKLPLKEIVQLLLRQYISYIGISKGYRTVYFDFAWAVLENSPELWNEDEKKSGYSQLTDHLKDYFPDYIDSDNDDVTILNAGEYLKIGFDVLDDDIDSEELRIAFCYAMYIFFKNGDFEELEDIKVAVEDAE